MIIGYEISGYDNDSYMSGSWNRFLPEVESIIPACSECGFRSDYRFINPHFKLQRKIFDYSSTYDGIDIVSQKFKAFCIRYGYPNLAFGDIPSTPYFYSFSVNQNLLPYNFRLKEKLCSACGQYESIAGPALNLDVIKKPLADGFYQSDLWFGSGNEKSPVIIIAPSTKANLDKEKFKTICFKKIDT